MLDFKVLLVGAYLIQSVFIFGQKTEAVEILNSKGDVSQYLELRISQLQTTDFAMIRLHNDWGLESETPKRYMSITHVPENDFNIYLSFNNSITPNILTSFEVSLNYAGVMNIRSLIVLRK